MPPPSSNSRTNATECEAIQTVARQYQDEGYDVIIQPQPDQLPSFAAQFQPTVAEGDEPTPEAQAAANQRLVDSDVTLPEEETEREG